MNFKMITLLLIILTFCVQSKSIDIKQKNIDMAIEKLKNDQRVLEDFYFIGRMQCYLYAKVGKQRYIKRSMGMMYDTNTNPFVIIETDLIKKHFIKKFTNEILLAERKKLAPNQDIYTNRHRPEYWTGYYVCDTLNRLSDKNIAEYKIFLENVKTEIYTNKFKYPHVLAYLNQKKFNKPKASETTKMTSILTNKKYIAEASAIRGSMLLANLKIDVPKKYMDDTGRVGKMKDKPIIATAKKFKKFMDSEFKGKKINLETNNTCTLDYLQKKFGNEKGLYIFIPKKPQKFGLTGYITLWDRNESNAERDYYQNYKGNATLYIFGDKD